MSEQTLAETLAKNTKEGVLYEAMPDGRLRCFACGHRCPIPEGRAGVCRVRFNSGGKLQVPWGYVGALQDDPIEKKPFFHALPGARALSFGMLGCDFHCGYCFSSSTRIFTSQGVIPIGEIVLKKIKTKVYSHTGTRQTISGFFERSYFGPMLKIKPAFLPVIESTPDHPFYACLRPDRYPKSKAQFIKASQLTAEHCIVIPKNFEFSEDVTIETSHHLEPYLKNFRVKRSIPVEILERILQMTRGGSTSRQIAQAIGKSASRVRHIRSKFQSKKWDLENLSVHAAELIKEGKFVRFSKEHAPGIPASIKVGSEFAELLGFYCAEGCVVQNAKRVHSAALSFSFSKKEKDKAERVKFLLHKVFGVSAYLANRITTLAVCSNKTSLAILFKALCGGRGSQKQVPEFLFRCERQVVKSFLDAYVAGDGYCAPDGHIRISSISQDLAWGIAGLVQKLGYLPQYYSYAAAKERLILGRKINQAPKTYLVRWYETPKKQRHVWENDQYRYVLVEKSESFFYNGTVYNLETGAEHSYLANFMAVHNCQNWVTSQALRDPAAVAPPMQVGPKELVRLALERDCKVLASTYNEPLITSEWAVEIFKEARRAGLVTAYISNGNGTPEVLDFIRPWVDLYKVDLKSFDDRHYRELGGSLENVCRTIRELYERKFWLEIVTLLIPGFNDSSEEIRKLSEFIVSVSPDIPWHVTAFHQDYKMMDRDNTSARQLLAAAEIGKKAGLHYIYPGNLPGKVGNGENTYCPNCHEVLIRRFGFQVLKDKVTPHEGFCFKCRTQIPGFWKKITR